MRRVFLLSSLMSLVVATAVVGVFFLVTTPKVDGVPTVVRAQRFDVVDQDGRVRARLGGSPSNEALAILDANGTERVGLKLLADGTSMLYLADGQGRIRANFYVNQGGSATAVQLFDAEGKTRQGISLAEAAP